MLKHQCFVINVYSKCDLPAKRRLWDSLIALRMRMGEGGGGGAWCILGDFNSVAEREERRGVNEEVSSTQREKMFWHNMFVREIN